MPGKLISIDGVDGGGKSTQLDLLGQWLERHGVRPIRTRDPGGTQLGEALREILLHRHEIPIDMTAEMLVYMASRAQLVAERIEPAIAVGEVVLCDRFVLANVVYQGVAGGLPVDSIWQVAEIATAGRLPDMTVVLDIDPAVAMQRIDRGLDRLESRGLEFMQQVRQGFLQQAQRLGGRVMIVDATQSIGDVHEQIVARVTPLLNI